MRSRHAVAGLAAASAALLAACSAAPGTPPDPAPAPAVPAPAVVPAGPPVAATDPAASGPARPASTPAGQVPTAPGAPSTPARPGRPAWQVSPRDADPVTKVLATDLLTSVGTWAVGGSGTGAQRWAQFPVSSTAIADLVASGLDRGSRTAAARVVTAQLGGLLPGSASVMVVLELTTPTGSHDRTFDVRLRRGSHGWQVARVLPARPAAPVTDPGPLAWAVLEASRIRLPAAARADVAAGRVAPRLLALLLALARRHDLDVTVLASGHPYRIFDKPQVSDHSLGRAVDVWAVDGRPVVSDAPARVLRFMRLAARLGAYQVGGPLDPGPPSAPYYTDDVHLDHVHVGVPPVAGE